VVSNKSEIHSLFIRFLSEDKQMPSAATIRFQVEAALSRKIPSALTPAAKNIRPVAPIGIREVDELLEGGLPVGAITEMVGPESSGRTAVALSFISRMTGSGKVCAWVDVSDSLIPESAAAAGVALSQVLWVRCGVTKPASMPSAAYKFALPEKYLIAAPAKQGLHGGGCGGHPRNETKGLSEAVSGFLRPESFASRCAEPQRKLRVEREPFTPAVQPRMLRATAPMAKPWGRIEQALRVTDLLLQAGGFSAVVLDMASIAPDYASRVPLATWFRYRAAAERTQATFLLLTQHPCAKSSGELLLRFQPGEARNDETTVFAGIEHSIEVERRRFAQPTANVVPLRKPPQRVNAHWKSQSTWAGAR
jgi:recombination protein RecA